MKKCKHKLWKISCKIEEDRVYEVWICQHADCRQKFASVRTDDHKDIRKVEQDFRLKTELFQVDLEKWDSEGDIDFK